MAKTIIRLKDIADRTGFSTNTVSLALRNSPRIPQDTRETIQAAAQALNYLPNQIAKSLVSRETKTIGLVLTEITNPALTATAQVLEQALGELGYGILFATSNNTLEDEIRVLEMFRSRQVDGMLIYPTSHSRLDHIRPLRRANLPVVLLVGDPDSGIDSVSIDDRHGAFKATNHLIKLGHKHIGLLDGTDPEGNLEKMDGYKQALKEANIAFDPSLIVDPLGSTAMHGYEAMPKFLQTNPKPTAIFASTDIIAIGAMKWCLQNDLKVPGDMAIAGFDNTEFAQFAAVPLTSIDYTAQEIARKAVHRLMELVQAGDELPAPQATLIDPDLVVRASTGNH